MAVTGEGGILRRKIAASGAERAEGGPGADRGWRLALARAARDRLHLALELARLDLSQLSLAELLELPPDRALIAVLQGPGEAMGVMMLAPEVLAGMIEVQTLGRVASTPLPARRPTRTDAAMVAEMMDAALVGLETALAEEADLTWAGGFRYASFLDDPRPLGLVLDDVAYHLLRAEVVLGQAARRGAVLLALPVEGRGAGPVQPPTPTEEEGQASTAFAAALAAEVEAADCVLDAVLGRVSLTIAGVMAMRPGDVLALPQASIDRLGLVGLDGRVVADGRLGQQRGLRAVRLVAEVQAASMPAQTAVAVGQTAPSLVTEPERRIA